MNEEKLYLVHMGPAKCAVDLGDGSERGEYVNQDYILQKLGRPHRSIGLMYCYYPLDEGWPGRASVVHANKDVSYAWDYPYDDYFVYTGGLNGDRESELFQRMKEIRKHGQDVTLTLTIDPHVSDEHLIAIANDLRPYGRLFLRINHEATGDWFSFTKRCTYQEIADFFCRFHGILKQYAPNVKTILCTGGVEDPAKNEIEKEAEFASAVKVADMWSIDKYFALHWGWPYDVALPGGKNFGRSDIGEVYTYTQRSFERFKQLNGNVAKPMMMSELNADGDVTGPFEQTEMVKDFITRIKKYEATWFTSFSMYQFRDRGRLGLETEDPNNCDVGIEQPLMKVYRDLIHDEYFSPSMTTQREIRLPLPLRWTSSEDADGIELDLFFEKNPCFCEVNFEDDGNYIMELNGRWFYKSPQAKTIDLMSAFYDYPINGARNLKFRIFCPPVMGENDMSRVEGLYHNYTVVEKLPKFRIAYQPVL